MVKRHASNRLRWFLRWSLATATTPAARNTLAVTTETFHLVKASATVTLRDRFLAIRTKLATEFRYRNASVQADTITPKVSVGRDAYYVNREE